MLKKPENVSSSFDRLRMRSSDFNGSSLMVSLSNHELVAVRLAHREAMGDIVFLHPANALDHDPAPSFVSMIQRLRSISVRASVSAVFHRSSKGKSASTARAALKKPLSRANE
jgi:hypothetical protein